MAVALVTSDPTFMANDPDLDMPLLVDALGAVGISARSEVWHDPSVDWSDFDLVILRSTWDYSERLSQFRSWLGHVAGQARLANCASMVMWNLDKTYLHQLSRQGVPTVPTQFAADPAEVRDALEQTASDRVVIKPTASAGSRNTGLFEHSDPAALELASQILASGSTVMVQPEVPAISSTGETAILSFGGAPSHAIRKGPLLALGGGLQGGRYRETISPETPSADQLRTAARALSAVEAIGKSSGWPATGIVPLYARFVRAGRSR